jgi:LysM domain-containing protein
MTVLIDRDANNQGTRHAERSLGAGRLRPPTRPCPVAAPPLVGPAGCAPRRAPLPVSWLVGLGAFGCLVVVGLGVLAGASAPAVPATTAVVRVVPGENLWDVAERAAPGSDTGAVVARIRELNGLAGSEVRPGQPLTVPVER